VLSVPTLRFLDGQHVGRSFPLTQERVMLGCRDGSTIRCADPGIAPEHAAIELQSDGRRVVVAIGGPVLVNGQGTSRAHLRDGDILIFSVDSIARFELRSVVAGRSSAFEELL